MKILLTGVAGFVGWKTAQLLLSEQHEVVGLDELNDYYSPALKRWRLGQLESQRSGTFSFYQGSIEDLALLRDVFTGAKFDAVINLAARAGVRASLDNPWVYQSTNVGGTLNLLECMKEFEVKKFVLASSSSLYAGQEAPFREDQKVDQPLSPYAASKKAAEVLSYSYSHLYSIDTTIVRYFTVYGPAGRPDMSPLKFCHHIAQGLPIPLYGDGAQMRDFTYIDDIASGTVSALKPLGYEIINLGGGGEPLKLLEMIDLLADAIGRKPIIKKLPFNDADMMCTQASNEKARDLLDWQSTVSPKEGVARLVRWYQENENLIKEVYGHSN